MPARSYGQACALATALDVIGSRWTILILRELLAGPGRYVDIHRGLPGLASNLLTGRLRELEDRGLVERTTGPYDVTLYQLTALGKRTRPALEELGKLGLILGPAATEQTTQPESLRFLAMATRALLSQAPTSSKLDVGLLVDGQSLNVHVDGPEIEVTYEQPATDTPVIEMTYELIRDVLVYGADPQRLHDEAAVVSGDPQVLEELVTLFEAAGSAVAASLTTT